MSRLSNLDYMSSPVGELIRYRTPWFISIHEYIGFGLTPESGNPLARWHNTRSIINHPSSHLHSFYVFNYFTVLLLFTVFLAHGHLRKTAIWLWDVHTTHSQYIYIYIHFKLYLCKHFKLYLCTHECYVECCREINLIWFDYKHIHSATYYYTPIHLYCVITVYQSTVLVVIY